jgi:hypothetical protein
MSAAERRRRGKQRPEEDGALETPALSEDAQESAPAPKRRRGKAAPSDAEEQRTPLGAQKRTTPLIQQDEDPLKRGYRSTKRMSKGGKQLRKQAEAERVKAEVSERTGAAARVLKRVATIGGGSAVSLVLVLALLWGAAIGVNALARWNARRLAAAEASKSRAELAKENLLVIGIKDKEAIGFVALKAERAGNRTLGINIPDGAFVEVPGQGYESIGDSYHGGPEISKDAVSNFLMVPFEHYVTVTEDVFQRMVTAQDVKELIARALATDLTSAEKSDLAAFFSKVPSKDVWIVPMPVKPITVGSERYFEPQRGEIADLVLQWWNVRFESQKQAPRVALYNGVGTPGVAGKAAQQLIRRGFRVVDSKNADNFEYKTTKILLYHGTKADAESVKDALGGTGEITVESAVQNVADIIVVVGADYVPPATP